MVEESFWAQQNDYQKICGTDRTEDFVTIEGRAEAFEQSARSVALHFFSPKASTKLDAIYLADFIEDLGAPRLAQRGTSGLGLARNGKIIRKTQNSAELIFYFVFFYCSVSDNGFQACRNVYSQMFDGRFAESPILRDQPQVAVSAVSTWRACGA
jgi:hypothetical protein